MEMPAGIEISCSLKKFEIEAREISRVMEEKPEISC